MAINREQLKDVFNELGIGKNGFISIDEFSKLCDYFGMNMTTQELKKRYQSLDTDADGKVSNNEFLAGMFRKDSLNDKTTKTPEENKTSKPKEPDKSPKVTEKPKKGNSDETLPLSKTEEENANQGKSLMSDLFDNFIDKKPHYATRSGASDWLNYLDPERTGSISGAEVIDFWEKIGVPNGRKNLEMLKFDPDGQIQPSDLSHALERELHKPENNPLHQVAVDTVLHSTDKFWNDNLDLGEECERLRGDMEEIKKNVKESEDELAALAQKKDMEIKLLQEANQKLREATPAPSDLQKGDELKKIQEELERQLEKSAEECKKLKQKNFSLESEIEKLKKDLETMDDASALLSKENEQLRDDLKNSSSPKPQEVPSSQSLDIDDSMSPDEVRKKVKGELDRIQRLASMERKETEGALLVEISELERKHAEQLDQMKKNHDKEKADMISTHKRDLEDALAKKEKELMTDYALDKMNSSPDSTVQLEEKISELEKEIKKKNEDFLKQAEELFEKSKLIEDLNSRTMKEVSVETDSLDGSDPSVLDEGIPKKEFTNVSTETEPINILEDESLEKIPLVKSSDALTKEKDIKSLPPVMVEASTEMDPIEDPKESLEKVDNLVVEKPVLVDACTETEPQVKPSEEDVKKGKLEPKLINTLDELRDGELKIKELTEENEKLKTDYVREIEDIKSSHAKDLDNMKMSYDVQMKDLSDNLVVEKPVLVDACTEAELQVKPSEDDAKKGKLESKLIIILDELRDAELKNKELTEENEKLKTDYGKEIEDIKSSHAKDLDNMKMLHDVQMKDLSEKHERDVAVLKKAQEDEILNLQEEHDMIKKSTDQKLEDANKKVADLTEELLQIDTISEALEKKLNECDQKITNQEQELAAKDSELAAKNNELKEKEGIIADLEKQLEEHLAKIPEPAAENSTKEMGNGIEKLREDYESQIAQMKKDHVAEMESLCKNLPPTSSRDQTARRFTLPTDGTKEGEIHPKFSDLIKGFESKISDSENITKPLKKLGKISEEAPSVDAGPPEPNKDISEVVQDYESKIADMKKQFEAEKKDMTQKHENNLKKEQDTVNGLQEKLNVIERKKNKELSDVIKDYEDKISEINKQAQQEKEALEKKLKDQEKTEIDAFRRPSTRALLPTEESVLPSTRMDTRSSPDIIQEYEKKLEELKKQSEKEKKYQKEAYEQEAERAKEDFRIALAQLNKAMDDKLAQAKASDDSAYDDRIKDITNDYEQKIYDLKVENDSQSAQLQHQIGQRDEELKEKYKDLLKELKERKDGEIELLNNTIKNLRKDLTDMRKNASQILPKDPGLELLQRNQIDDLAKENKKLRAENLQLQAALDAKQYSDDSKTDSFQKLLLHNADLNAEKDLLKDQLKRTLDQLNKVTDTLTALTSQHRADKKAWSLANQKLVNPLKHQELVDKVSKLEATNQRMQAILERNQLDTSKALTSTRESYDKEIKDLLRERDAINDQAQRLRRVVEEKDRQLFEAVEKQDKGDRLTKDLYVENARLIKYLQQLEKQILEANSKIQMLEEKCLVLGNLIRKICPAAIS